MKTRVRRHPGLRLLATALLSLAAPGCSSSTGPEASVALRVVNATCDPGPCVALQVRAFPSDQPPTPGGLWSIDLGTVRTDSDCLVLPQSAHFDVTDASSGHTTTWRWTPGEPVALGALLPGEAALMATPSTGTFVPAGADGWTVILPGGTSVTRGATCPGPID